LKVRIIGINEAKNEAVEAAIEVLKSGGVIVYPTETCYGIGVDLTQPEAVERLWRFKGEREGKPVLAAISSLKMAEEYTDISVLGKKVVQKYWPGPVAIVALSKGKIAKKAQGETDTIGLRMSANILVTEIVESLGKPISSTSANISGGNNPYSLDQFLEETPKERVSIIDLFVDAGELPQNRPSTVIDTRGETLKVLRQGEVVVEI